MKRFWGLIPAAGVGSRMGQSLPKQYLQLGQYSMLERAVRALLADTRVAHVFVITAPQDPYAKALSLPEASRCVPLGANTRARTVHQGLAALWEAGARSTDAVLVHDAARPCLNAVDLAALIEAALVCPDGAILANPLGDTLKRVSVARPGHIAETVPRDGLWRALTPQCFDLGLLQQALDQYADHPAITDEASAIERLGRAPQLVPGSASNLKITTPEDLPLAQAILMQQGTW